MLYDENAVTSTNGTATEVESISIHDLQIYGIVVTILLCVIVFGGVNLINRVAPAFLIPVLFSILCIFIGLFQARMDHPTSECSFDVFFSFLFLRKKSFSTRP